MKGKYTGHYINGNSGSYTKLDVCYGKNGFYDVMAIKEDGEARNFVIQSCKIKNFIENFKNYSKWRLDNVRIS